MVLLGFVTKVSKELLYCIEPFAIDSRNVFAYTFRKCLISEFTVKHNMSPSLTQFLSEYEFKQYANRTIDYVILIFAYDKVALIYIYFCDLDWRT
jgi:hypothetical protein